MAIILGANIAAQRAQRQLGTLSTALESTYERLSSGQRINRASDDAAGLSIASSLQVRSRVYSQAMRNISDGISLLNIADSAAQELSTVLLRVQELATQSANGTFSNQQRQTIDKEAQSLHAEYNRIVKSTSFNGLQVLDGSMGILQIQAGFGETLNFAQDSVFSRSVGDGTFQSAVMYPGTATYHNVVVADVNGDGKNDFIDTPFSGGIRTFLANGDGTFSLAASFATALPPNSFTATDLNGDGKLDLILAREPTQTIDVLWGSGTGSFTASGLSISASLGTAIEIKAQDLNNDGTPDLVVGGQSTGNLSVLIGNGNGTFKAMITIANPGIVEQFVLVDVNKDGKIDAVSGNGSSRVRLMLGNGDGTFAAGTTLFNQVSGAVTYGDINGDGNLDFIVEESAGSALAYLGNGDATFRAPLTVAAAPGVGYSSFTVVDLNDDGRFDLVAQQNTGATPTVISFLGNGDGTFAAPYSMQTDAAIKGSVSIADMNGDGVADIVAATANSVSLFFANSARATSLFSVSVATRNDALSTLTKAKTELEYLAQFRSRLGAFESRLAVENSNLASAREGSMAAVSRIQDADVAVEATDLTRRRILQRVASAVLAQANQEPALALRLLQG